MLLEKEKKKIKPVNV